MIKKILILCFGFFINPTYASGNLQRSDQEFYDDGVMFRKAGNYNEAKKCFSAAVFSKDDMLIVKALYNLGHISYLEERIQDASLWFFQSNEAHKALHKTVFQPAVKGSQKLLQGSILSFFSPAKEIFSAPNRDIRDLFTQVTFSSEPTAISLKQSYTVKDGDVEVHFRDADHLRAIVERTPLFSGKNTYYILDANVEDGKEFRASGGTGHWEKFVHVEGDEGLELKGSIPYLPFTFVLPKQATHSELSASCSGFQTALTSLNESLRLLNYLADISDESITVQKEKARALLIERRLDREARPEEYPSLEEVAPDRRLLSDAIAYETQRDYIGSEFDPFYVASDRANLQSLKETIPMFDGNLFFVDPHLTSDGIYTDQPLVINKGFKVKCSGNLVVLGEFPLEEYCLKLISERNMWLIGANLEGKSIFVSGANVSLLMLWPIGSMERPKRMSDPLWSALCQLLPA